MKILLILFALTLQGFSQDKKLQENFGTYRIHEVQSFFTDTTDNLLKARMIILREGIDGVYDIETPIEDKNKTIEYLHKKIEYSNFIITE